MINNVCVLVGTFQIRQQLVQLSNDLKKRNQIIKKLPETTIKGGALKADRKTKRTPLWMDDLASLEKLTEVNVVIVGTPGTVGHHKLFGDFCVFWKDDFS